MAREQRRLHALYDELNMFDEARNGRRLTMQLLRTARTLWRRGLGFVS